MTADLNPSLLPRLARQNDRKILFVVLDGLGGRLGAEPTALQRSRHPHLDELARVSALGRHVPVAEGITPGSGPGHFAIFGYDALAADVGRGILETLGLGIEVGRGDVTARGNFCTLDAAGRVTDRRAGRIPTEQAAPLVAALAGEADRFEDVRAAFHPGLQHRFALVLQGPGLDPRVADTDPQVEGEAPLAARALDPAAGKTARIADLLGARAREVLRARSVANGVLLRGFSAWPDLPTLGEMARLRPLAVAAYPAYRGVARILGMDVRWDVSPKSTPADSVAVLEDAWGDDHDFYFLHVKGTDSAGEDGDEERKARVIEAFDEVVPRLRALGPDVIVITGDHATPGPLAAHSWHPVPLLIHGAHCEPDGVARFDEESCRRGGLGGHLPATAILRHALANALKLQKFGA